MQRSETPEDDNPGFPCVSSTVGGCHHPTKKPPGMTPGGVENR
jgi:hypothetical protein